MYYKLRGVVSSLFCNFNKINLNKNSPKRRHYSAISSTSKNVSEEAENTESSDVESSTVS